MDDDDVTLISVDVGDEQEADGVPPYVQFVTYREAMVRGEVSSNQSLAPQHALSEDGEARLVKPGWRVLGTDDESVEEGAANFFFDAERRQADRCRPRGR